PLREDDDRILGSSQMSRWFYATAKAADEALATAYWLKKRTAMVGRRFSSQYAVARASSAYWLEKRLPTIAVRFFNTIGPRQTGRYGMVVPRFIGQAL